MDGLLSFTAHGCIIELRNSYQAITTDRIPPFQPDLPLKLPTSQTIKAFYDSQRAYFVQTASKDLPSPRRC